MASDDFTVYQAITANTEPDVLRKMAEQRHDLRQFVATNPTTPDDVLQWLGELSDPVVDAALRRRAGHPPAGTSEASAPHLGAHRTSMAPAPQQRVQPMPQQPVHPVPSQRQDPRQVRPWTTPGASQPPEQTTSTQRGAATRPEHSPSSQPGAATHSSTPRGVGQHANPYGPPAPHTGTASPTGTASSTGAAPPTGMQEQRKKLGCGGILLTVVITLFAVVVLLGIIGAMSEDEESDETGMNTWPHEEQVMTAADSYEISTASRIGMSGASQGN